MDHSRIATNIRSCGACGRSLAWWRSATWHFGVLHCRRCLREATRTQPRLTRYQLWVEVRSRLIVLGAAVVVLGAMAVPLRGSVHIGPPPPDDAPYMHEYAGAVTAWSKGESGLGGWVENQTDRDCPSMLVWVQSLQMDDLSPLLGPVAVTNGYIAVGPLRAHQRMVWAGQRTDPRGHLVPLSTPPLPDPSFDCYR